MHTTHSTSKRKKLGAYYTPKVLADFIARTALSLIKHQTDQALTVLDPATGESSLLEAFSLLAKQQSIEYNILGIDIDKSAIIASKSIFSSIPCNSSFILTDGLYPIKGKNNTEGWKHFISKHSPNGIDLILSNPPWGVETDKYTSLQDCFETATGQFDIYDLFIESSIRILKNGGCYAFIVPDSIYNQEHSNVRRLLFEQTTILQIVRLGEGFFDKVNMATSIILGIKTKTQDYQIKCSHLSSHLRKSVLSNTDTFEEAIKKSTLEISANRMISSGYKFITDENADDTSIMSKLNGCSKIKDWCTTRRGAELSKKGKITFCNYCNNWFPAPRKSNDIAKCPYCKVTIKTQIEKCIINSTQSEDSESLIVGEDIQRYHTTPKSYILLNYKGINYKSEEIYKGNKILVRKTGVGITAGIDYSNSWTNQVVYIIKTLKSSHPAVTNEVILSVINSRIVTYYIIKETGSNGWKTHAYLSQHDVENLPFPIIETDCTETIKILNKITELVKRLTSTEPESAAYNKLDAKIEKQVATLFGITKEEYDTIFQALNNVQKMIPFKRLLNITTKQIFQ